MKKIKNKISHKDKRGLIIDLLENKKVNSITFITQKKGKVRGNHFHKNTIQWNYVIKGKIELYTQKKNSATKKTILSKGEIAETSKNEKHAIKALSDSEFLVFTQGPRGGKNYEKDTFRLLKPLIS
jgi:quercetin dioxygenase-like cupin family protein